MQLFIRGLEVVFTIGFVGLVLTHSSEFASVVTNAGSTYAKTVSGLQGRK